MAAEILSETLLREVQESIQGLVSCDVCERGEKRGERGRGTGEGERGGGGGGRGRGNGGKGERGGKRVERRAIVQSGECTLL